MKTLVVLSPSSQPENECRVCGSEEAHCRHLAVKIKQYLDNYDDLEVHIVPKQDPKLSESEKLNAIINFSNDLFKKHKGLKLHMPLHSNAHDGNASGHLVMTYPGNIKTAEFAELIKRKIGKWTRLEQRNDLAEIRDIAAHTVYMETFFHDNIGDAWDLHSRLDNLYQTIATCILYFDKV